MIEPDVSENDNGRQVVAGLKAEVALWKDKARHYPMMAALIDDGNKQIAELKAKLEDAGMRERRLRRALYKACANWADIVAFEETEGIGYDNSVAERWRKMERKCLKKAEEYGG